MRLPPVLSATDLSAAELQAARLDGEVYGLADAYCLIGEIESPAHRARAVLEGRSRRLIAELGTAAWIWGAADVAPRLEFAVTPDARARLAPSRNHAVREIAYAEDDVTEVEGCRVTTPLRTAVDLARFADPFPAETVSRLAAIAGFALADCLALLHTRPGIPSKKRAARKLSAALTP